MFMPLDHHHRTDTSDPGMPKSGRAWLRAIDDFVIRIYRAGFLQSCIVHCVVLTLLALTIIRPEDSRTPRAIALSFNAEQDLPVMLEDSAAAEFEAVALAADHAPNEREEPRIELAVPPTTLPQIDPLDLAESDVPSPLAPVDEAVLLEEVPARRLAVRRTRFVQVAAPGSPVTGSVVGAGGDAAMRGGGAIGGEMGRRLNAAGARTGDVQVSIAWDNANDIDVHVMVEPLQFGRASMISFMSPRGICGGMLDVDANAHPMRLTNQPVENVFWQKGMAPFGRYTIAVHHFQNWAGPMHTNVDVAVLVDGDVRTFKTLVSFGAAPRVVTSFVRRPPAAGTPPAVFPASAAE